MTRAAKVCQAFDAVLCVSSHKSHSLSSEGPARKEGKRQVTRPFYDDVV